MTDEEISRGRHLGDGVYASFDGFQIWLAVNDHRNRVVAIEPGVFNELVRYQQDLKAHFNLQLSK